MKLMIINGVNLNMLGIREPGIYGNTTYQDLVNFLEEKAKERNIEIKVVQSNHEGVLVDFIQECYFEKYDGIAKDDMTVIVFQVFETTNTNTLSK